MLQSIVMDDKNVIILAYDGEISTITINTEEL